jgi:hypothetical protein
MMYGLTGGERGPDGEYIVNNYFGSEYRVVIIATEFPGGDPEYRPGVNVAWGPGVGPWVVKYREVAETFWRLVERYQPVSLQTFTRDSNGIKWLFETAVRNNANVPANRRWSEAFGQYPFVGGDIISDPPDPASAPGRPNEGRSPIGSDPPDTTFPACVADLGLTGVRQVSNDTKTLITTISNALRAAFPSSVLVPEESTMGNPPDNFVSAYVGYLAVWYQAYAPQTCRFAFHTHVQYGLSLEVCQRALCVQLATTIIALK